MRVLLLTHRMPYPPNKGDKIRSFNTLKFLAARHEVHVASLIDDPADLAFTGDLQKIAKSFAYADISRRSKATSLLRATMSGSSITVAHFYSRELQRRIDAMLEREPFDAVLCFSSPMAEYVFRSRHAAGSLRGIRRLMDLIDVDSYKWAQYSADRSPPSSWVYAYEASRLGAYERRIVAAFDRVFVVSDQEKTLLPSGTELEKVSAIGNGVDLKYFAPVPSATERRDGPTLVFIGVMDYWPNIDGVRWFVESILPHIRRAVPDVAFQIVGSRPVAEIRKLAQLPGVTVTGSVPDVRSYLERADVCVVPLRIARGIQNKVLEAMAMGKPVVSTVQAFEGIRATGGEEVLVAADEQAFAAAVIELLNEPARAQHIGERARACVEAHYSWEENLQQLDELLQPDNSVAL